MPGWTVIIRRADDLETDVTHVDYQPAPGATSAQIVAGIEEALSERHLHVNAPQILMIFAGRHQPLYQAET
jgi:hypothetical protein